MDFGVRNEQRGVADLFIFLNDIGASGEGLFQGGVPDISNDASIFAVAATWIEGTIDPFLSSRFSK